MHGSAHIAVSSLRLSDTVALFDQAAGTRRVFLVWHPSIPVVGVRLPWSGGRLAQGPDLSGDPGSSGLGSVYSARHPFQSPFWSWWVRSMAEDQQEIRRKLRMLDHAAASGAKSARPADTSGSRTCTSTTFATRCQPPLRDGPDGPAGGRRHRTLLLAVAAVVRTSTRPATSRPKGNGTRRYRFGQPGGTRKGW